MYWIESSSRFLLSKYYISYPSICSNTHFFALRHFLLFKLSLFKQAVISLTFLQCNASHSKQAAVMFLFLPFQFTLFSEVRKFLYLPFAYKARPRFLSINSSVIDSFLDWEGHHWDSRSTDSSHHRLQFLPSVILLPTHTFYAIAGSNWHRPHLISHQPYVRCRDYMRTAF